MTLSNPAASTTATIASPRADFDEAVRLRAAGKRAESRAVFETILADHPDHVGIISNIGVIAWEQGDLQGALDYLMRAVNLDPSNPVRLRSLGTILLHTKSYDCADEAFRRAIEYDPRDPLSRHGLGVALRHRERWDEAAAALHEAIALDPALSDAFDELALVKIGQGELAAANELLNEAVRLSPNSCGAWSDLGSLLMKCNRPAEAADAFRRAIALKPDEPDYHTDLGTALLQQGDFKRGWQEYEQRWHGSILGPYHRSPLLPQWDGSATPRTILLHAEQGLGDGLQFCRYAPLVAARGHQVVLEVHKELAGLIAQSLGSDAIRVAGRADDYPGIAGLPPVDAHCPLMSLPIIFGTMPDTIPNRPYLRADLTDCLAWRERLSASAGALRVGVVWAGNPRRGAAFAVRETDARRSMALAALAPLFDVPGAQFISLQKGAAASELRKAGYDAVYDADPELNSFADTAALVANLDLVICVDTSVAHLVGGMGKPVWMLSRFDGCWRWLQDRADSPWYPTMRIFRQGPDRSWDRVVGQVRECLVDRVAAHRRSFGSAV